ncbi:MAG: type IV pilus twitching motility protein PilT [Peptostreptococcaceae bacterium]|nr:type IV pilus twitching motility protein PilT [Peptostreptococcaceae bacterium]
MKAIDKILEIALSEDASDVHIATNSPPVIRKHGRLQKFNVEPITPEQGLQVVRSIIDEKQWKKLQEDGQIDFAYALEGKARFRVNAYRQRGSYNLAFRLINDRIPSMEQLRLPGILKDLSMKQRGLILVTGPTGSGKSTTLASMVDYMNKNRKEHIITIEDPIEYLHRHGNCVINQRELGADTNSFDGALRAALRQDPDIIQVGEMRDLETIATALTAAETGHLVMSTLHTIGGAKTIDRIVDAFNADQQGQVRLQLSTVLEAVISQQIVPRADGKGRTVALEILIATPAIRNLIREAKTPQIQTQIQTGAKYGMVTMDGSLINLYMSGYISLETLRKYAVDIEFVNKQIGVI